MSALPCANCRRYAPAAWGDRCACDVGCPHCGAPVGWECRSLSTDNWWSQSWEQGLPTRHHAKRIAIAGLSGKAPRFLHRLERTTAFSDGASHRYQCSCAKAVYGVVPRDAAVLDHRDHLADLDRHLAGSS